MIGMKKYVRISRFAHFKRLRDRPTNQPTNRPTNRPTDMTSYGSARTHLKIIHILLGGKQEIMTTIHVDVRVDCRDVETYITIY